MGQHGPSELGQLGLLLGLRQGSPFSLRQLGLLGLRQLGALGLGQLGLLLGLRLDDAVSSQIAT